MGPLNALRKYVMMAAAVSVLLVVSLERRQLSGDDRHPPAPGGAVLSPGLRAFDLEGKQHTLDESSKHRGTVLVFLNIECPLCNEAMPRVNKLAGIHRKQGIEFFGVLTDASVSRSRARDHYKEFQATFPVLIDSGQTLQRLTGATHTPQVFVFDQGGREIYRGLIDDSSTRLGKKVAAKKHYLSDALQALANGRRVVIPQTQAVGCLIETPVEPADAAGTITYTRDIAPILFANCVVCHREGEVAPFPLTTFEEATRHALQIVEVTESKVMPPWQPAANYGHFANERRLSENQIALLRDWTTAGTPQGNSDDLPPLPKFPKGWQLGKPDMIVKMPRKFSLPADGPDLYQHFVIPLGLTQDRLIRAIEVHPGNSRIVHHAHMFVDGTGEARLLDDADPAMGYTRFGGTGLSSASYLGGWNPGATPHFFPRGTGRMMPRDGDAVFQIHYHPSGKPEVDQTEIGVYFAAADAQQLIADLVLGNVDLVIPAGAANVRFQAEYTTPAPVVLMEIRPHMHLLGKSYQVRAIKPDGVEVPLIKIENWDFNWQDSYVFDPLVQLPAGTRIQMEAVFDNSDQNPANPHSPPQTVYFGEESTDEMSNCAIRFTTETYSEFQQVVADNSRYWTGELKKYVDRNMTPDKKLRPSKPPRASRQKS